MKLTHFPQALVSMIVNVSYNNICAWLMNAIRTARTESSSTELCMGHVDPELCMRMPR
jgi:hypothetical protein